MTVGDKLCHYGLDEEHKSNEIGKIIAIYSYKKSRKLILHCHFAFF